MNTLISASAGSGKTHALTTEYLRLLQMGKRPETLLAATFTRKAAGEIFDRVLSRLAGACLEDREREELGRALGGDTLTQDGCREMLLSLCAGLGGLAVGTLDGFFQRLCGVYRQEAGLGGAARLSDPNGPRAVSLRREALRALLGRLPDAEAGALLDGLHQGKARSSVLGAFEELVAELTESLADAPPDAWGQLRVPPPPSQEDVERAVEMLGTAELSDSRARKAVTEDLMRFAEGRWPDFIGKGLAAKCLAGEAEYYKKPIPVAVVSHYEVLLGVARAELLGDLQRRTEAIRDVLGVFNAEYRTLRRREGLLLFSEAPGLLRPLIDDLGDATRRLDAPLDHLLLDEFQDTSDPQWAVLRAFARHAAQHPRSVFVVGDVKQAIYGWRGGRAEIFERIAAELPDMAHEARDRSFRSSAIVLGVVNRVFAALPDCPALGDSSADARDRWHGHFHPHEAHRDLPGCVTLHETPADADHGDHCAVGIAARIAALPPGASVGVLARKNDTVARLADGLRAHGLAVSSEGAGAVADDPAVEIILSALTLADHPGHTAAAFHVARSPLAAALGLDGEGGTAARVSTRLRRQILEEGYAGVIAGWCPRLASHGLGRTARRLEQLTELAARLDNAGSPPMRAGEFVRAVRDAAAEDPGMAGVRVMTINRAKGLEFDAVFLPELDWKASGPAPTCLVRRASPTEERPHPIAAVYSYPNESVRRLAPELEKAHAAMRDEEITGMLCLLYVALTRARHALHLYVRPGPPAGPTPANILRHALSDAPGEISPDGSTRLFHHGDAHWHGAVI